MREELKYLLSAKAVRERTKKIYELSLSGKTNFEVHEDKLPEVCEFVLEVIKDNYPTLEIPFHSRWGHFQVGNIDRNSKLDRRLKGLDPLEVARTKLDLVISSVLLDAGAGPTWSYDEDGTSFTRSEGLGVASWHMFMNGDLSTDGSLRVDSSKLMSITASDIEKGFQVSSSNPLVGVEGRAGLQVSLGKCVNSKKEIFKDGRPGNILDYMLEKFGKEFAATDLLESVLHHFGDIWPSRITVDGVSLGDVWSHPALGEKDDLNSLVAFHKLSQWLTYSLIEPFVEAGCTVHSVNKMTGLAEYRNGGLLIDSGLISLRDPSMSEKSHRPDSEIIIEWRALTVTLLDQIADIIRTKLNFSEDEFPLAKVLEGGTWWAGRRLAKQKREDSSPPLKLDSDGTVF